MKERGYIALARSALDHPIVGARKPFSHFEAWTWLLTQAAFKPQRVRVSNGHSHSTITLQRGQLTHSLRFMATAWGWSIKSVRTFLTRLETDTQIGTQKGAAQTLITICNYATYQNAASYKETQKGTQSGTQGARKGHKEEELNKETKDIAPDLEAGFIAWYLIYPRKKQRADARRAYLKLIASGAITAADLLERTTRYAAHWKTQPADRQQFIPYPASWLNSGEYADEIPQAVSSTAGGATVLKFEAPTQDPRTFSPAEWNWRLSKFEETKRWPEEYWGPAPGKPGCLVPAACLGGANV